MTDPRTVRLLVASEEGTEAEHVVTLPVAVGRDPATVDVVLADRMVSRRHARLETDGDRLVVVDLGSGNGTWIGDDRVERRPLDPDDVVTVGAHTLRWSWVDPPAPPEVELPPPDFGSAWGVVLGESGLRFLPLVELYEEWRAVAERVDDIAAGVGSHERFVAAVDELLDDHLARIAVPTIALCAPDTDVATFRARVARLRERPERGQARAAGGAALLEADRELATALSDAVRDGTRAFEEHGADVVRLGASRLMSALGNTLLAVARADDRLAAST